MAESKKQAKRDRNRKSGQNLAYKNESRHEKSHIRRIKFHLKRFPADRVAQKELERFLVAAGQFNKASYGDFLASVGAK